MSRFSRFTWIMSLLCVDTAISQAVMVKGYVGDGVLMSCVSSAGDFRPDQVNVYWRDKNDNVVLDIVKGVHDHGHSTRGPEQEGDFSVVLQNLREDDAGEYECNIPSEDVQKKFSLTVTLSQHQELLLLLSSFFFSSSSGNAALSLTLPLLLLRSLWQQNDEQLLHNQVLLDCAASHRIHMSKG
ncbi:hypothetical protein INR49_022804 [Caranx melampygus]|nr:hypothetical protein INR49_022804 [Caranx melampygus]